MTCQLQWEILPHNMCRESDDSHTESLESHDMVMAPLDRGMLHVLLSDGGEGHLVMHLC